MALRSPSLMKIRDLFLVFAVYFLTFISLFCLFMPLTSFSGILRLFIIDLCLTAVIYLFSLIFDNPSFYDPYWSLVPLLLAISYMLYLDRLGFYDWLAVLAFSFWSLRLTANWCLTFRDLRHEDWRYTQYRKYNPFLFQLVSFLGIMLMPTILTFLGTLPLFCYLEKADSLKPLAIIACIIIFSAALLELISDCTVHRFIGNPSNRLKVCRQGVYSLARHPNYAGEISVWFGVYLLILSVSPDKWYLGIGALLIYLLFRLVSIPMLERHELAKRPEYGEYRNEVPALLLWPFNAYRKRMRAESASEKQ